MPDLRRTALAALALSACAPPSTLGLLNDGTVPDVGRPEVLAGGGLTLPLREGEDPYVIGGAQLAFGVAPKTAVGLGVGLPLMDGGLDFVGIRAEARYRINEDGPVQLTVQGGVGEVGFDYYGLHAGGVLATPVGEQVRIFGGYVINPVFFSDESQLWHHLSLGATVRPATNSPYRIGLELGYAAIGGDGGHIWPASLWVAWRP